MTYPSYSAVWVLGELIPRAVFTPNVPLNEIYDYIEEHWPRLNTEIRPHNGVEDEEKFVSLD